MAFKIMHFKLVVKQQQQKQGCRQSQGQSLRNISEHAGMYVMLKYYINVIIFWISDLLRYDQDLSPWVQEHAQKDP